MVGDIVNRVIQFVLMLFYFYKLFNKMTVIVMLTCYDYFLILQMAPDRLLITRYHVYTVRAEYLTDRTVSFLFTPSRSNVSLKFCGSNTLNKQAFDFSCC